MMDTITSGCYFAGGSRGSYSRVLVRVWRAVFTFNPYLEISLIQLDISPIHLEISLIELEISPIQLEISLIRLFGDISK